MTRSREDPFRLSPIVQAEGRRMAFAKHDGHGFICRAVSFEGGESHFDKLLLTFGNAATLFAQNHKKTKRVGRI